jgi:iron-sulfur cluster assembly protein
VTALKWNWGCFNEIDFQEDDVAITITPAALSEIKRLLEKENKPELGLRVGVRPGGCSGFSYMLGFDTTQEGDAVQDLNGVKLFVDGKSVMYLEGTQLDYSDGLQGKGFTFSNPNASRTCGCGESFSV